MNMHSMHRSIDIRSACRPVPACHAEHRSAWLPLHRMGEEAETTYQRGLSHLLALDGTTETTGFAMAMRCFERAAESGHAGAQYGLAACYLSDEPKSGHGPR